MVFLKLEIKAELENVTDLAPAGDDFEYSFKVVCNSCHEEHKKFVTMKRSETRNISNSRGSAHLVWRCGNCKKESSASFVAEPSKPYSAESNGQFATLLKMECRGLEFTDFAPGDGHAREKTGTSFSDVELEDDDWVDYDEKAKVDVRISDIESRWTRA
ncbi:DUF866-domain-containing protein [Suillus subalutaceus]|uniref:DUF866-domain-containing protein n=1 Tax=Suillus subalutaceus TaxID=48586 RepID=UPI001B872368|nr:DUF866-domain-containing protein [Suillus subalutaceus]KAG1864295.1 DUF866-domain-containing protein [Suillus subalutaceus]